MAKPRKSSPGKPKQAAVPARPNRLYLIIGGIAAVIAVVAIITMRGGGGSGATEPVEIALEPADLQRARGVSMGLESAPVQIHEFADFQCPACAQFSTFAHPLIKERLVDGGLVRLVRYDFPLISIHPHAFLAARAGRCAEDGGLFWEFHDVLYGRQPSWSPQRDPRPDFVSYASLVGLDAREFEACLRSDRHAEEVTRNLRLGESLGVNGTPSFLLNGQRVSFADYRDIEERVFQITGGQAPPLAPPGN